jgi:hypothetical protein
MKKVKKKACHYTKKACHYTGFLVVKQPKACGIASVMPKSYV